MRRGGIIFSLSLLEITETSSSGKILGGDRPLLGIGGGGVPALGSDRPLVSSDLQRMVS